MSAMNPPRTLEYLVRLFLEYQLAAVHDVTYDVVTVTGDTWTASLDGVVVYQGQIWESGRISGARQQRAA